MQKIDTPFVREDYLEKRTYLETRVGKLPTEIRGDILRTSTDIIEDGIDQIVDPSIKHVQLTKHNPDLTFLKSLNILDGPRKVPIPVGSYDMEEPVVESQPPPSTNPFDLIQVEKIDSDMGFDMDIYTTSAVPEVPISRSEPRKRNQPDRYHDNSFSEGDAEDAIEPKTQASKRQKIKAPKSILIQVGKCSKKDIEALKRPEPTIFNMWGHPDVAALQRKNKQLLPPPPCAVYLSFIDTTPIEDSPNFSIWVDSQLNQLKTVLYLLRYSKYPSCAYYNKLHVFGDKVYAHCQTELPKSIYAGSGIPDLFAEEPNEKKMFPEYKDTVPVLLYLLKYRKLNFAELSKSKFIVHLSCPMSREYPKEYHFKMTAPGLVQMLWVWWAMNPAALLFNGAMEYALASLKEKSDEATVEALLANTVELKQLAKKSFKIWCYAVNFVQSPVAEEVFNSCKPVLPKHLQEPSHVPRTGRSVLKYWSFQ